MGTRHEALRQICSRRDEFGFVPASRPAANHIGVTLLANGPYLSMKRRSTNGTTPSLRQAAVISGAVG